jgi:hypothetical protein
VTSLPTKAAFALTMVAPGQQASILESPALSGEEANSLRAMGLRPGAAVRVVRVGQPTILEILSCGGPACGQCGCRMGLARGVAERVLVQPLPMGVEP